MELSDMVLCNAVHCMVLVFRCSRTLQDESTTKRKPRHWTANNDFKCYMKTVEFSVSDFVLVDNLV